MFARTRWIGLCVCVQSQSSCALQATGESYSLLLGHVSSVCAHHDAHAMHQLDSNRVPMPCLWQS